MVTRTAGQTPPAAARARARSGSGSIQKRAPAASKPAPDDLDESDAVPETTGTPATPGVRLIKKYPNRRLYDTATSGYVTLAEIKDLVMRGTALAVRDAKTGEDLTRSILLQIILEEEAGGSPLFSEAVLANIIRFYGHTMQGFFGANLESSIQAFADMQQKFMDMAPGFHPDAWQKMVAMPTQQSQKMMQDMMLGYAESRQALQQMQEQLQRQYQANMQQWLAAFQPRR